MQTVSGKFTGRTKAPMRAMTWQMLASFNKVYDAAINFFTIGTSKIGGTDIIQGSGQAIQQWDQYNYEDFSNRIISLGYTREADSPPLNSLFLTMAEIVLDNHDDLFTPTNSQGRYYGKLGNGRPVRLYIGFGDTEKIQVFVGLTQGLPNIDESAKTATFHCLDFIAQLQNVTLDQVVMTVNQRTDQVISSILQAAGLSVSQFNLDTGSVVIPFAFFDVGTKVGPALRDVAEAELGSVYMTENGVITFENRANWATHKQVWSLDRSNVYDISSSGNTVINQVEVKANARAVQAKQQVYKTASAQGPVPAGGTLDVWVDFTDANGALPVTSCDTPVYSLATGASVYQTNLRADGQGAAGNASISVSAFTRFSTSAKVTFSNSGLAPVYITYLELWGTPASVVNQIYVLQQDASSVAQYDVRSTSIANDYIQDGTAAASIASLILADCAQAKDQREMKIKGVPHLQIGDMVGFSDDKTNALYFATKIDAKLSKEDGYVQDVTLSQRQIGVYFRIGISTIGSTTDSIAP